MNPNPLKLLTFAQSRDLLGFSEKTIFPEAHATPRTILESIQPGFTTTHKTFRVALDEEYTSWDQPVLNSQVLAIIPPVSGG